MVNVMVRLAGNDDFSIFNFVHIRGVALAAPLSGLVACHDGAAQCAKHPDDDDDAV